MKVIEPAEFGPIVLDFGGKTPPIYIIFRRKRGRNVWWVEGETKKNHFSRITSEWPPPKVETVRIIVEALQKTDRADQLKSLVKGSVLDFEDGGFVIRSRRGRTIASLKFVGRCWQMVFPSEGLLRDTFQSYSALDLKGPEGLINETVENIANSLRWETYFRLKEALKLLPI